MAGLHFDITANDSQFQRKIAAVQYSVAQASKNIQNEGNEIDALMSRLTKGIAGIGASLSASALVKQMVNVRGEFQKLEIAFKTMLGSGEKSVALMGEAVNLAAITPFDLIGVASGYKQLLAYGFAMEDVTEIMTRLGNVAAGLSIPLNDLVYLFGTTRAQGRLYTQDLNQFTGRGIPMIAELAKQFGVAESEVKGLVEAGKVGFPQVQKVIESLTNSGGMFYNLMEEQSKTLSGQISNLEDSISQMFNEIGEQTQGFISEGISGVAYLVEHYEQVGKVLATLVAAYGTYRTALITTAALHKMQYTAGTVKAFLELTKGLTLAKKAQEAFNIAALKNPYVLLASAIVAAGVAIYNFANKTEEAEREIGELEHAVNNEQKEVNKLISTLGNANTEEDERRRIIEQLNRISPQNFSNITEEKTAVDDLTASLNAYNQEAAKRAVAASKQDTVNSLKQEHLTLETDKSSLQNDIMNAYNEVIKNFGKIKLQDNSIWGINKKATEEQLEEFKSRMQGVMLDQAKTFEQKANEIRQLLDFGGKGIIGSYAYKFNSNDTERLYKLIEQYNKKKIEALSLQRDIDEAEKEFEKTVSNLGLTGDADKKDTTQDTVKHYQDINALIDEQRKKIKVLTTEISNLRTGKTQSENLSDDIEAKEQELKAAKEALEILTGKQSKPDDYSYISKAYEQAGEMERDNTRTRLQNNAEVLKEQEDGIKRYYSIMRELEDEEYRHTIENIEKERAEMLKKAPESKHVEINRAFDRQAEAAEQTWKIGQQDIDRGEQTEMYKKELSNYQSFVDEYVRIAEEKKNRITEINREEEEARDANKLDKKRSDELNEKRTEAETIAQIDTNTLMASLGLSVDEVATELMGIVNGVISSGLETISAQLPVFAAELAELEKSGADPKKIARTSAAVKGLNAALNTAKQSQKKLGKETSDTTSDTIDKWESMKIAMRSVDNMIGVLDDSFGEMLGDAGKDAMDVIKTISSSTITVLMAITTTSVAASESIKAAQDASIILAIISAAVQVIMAITNALVKNFSAHAKYKKAMEESREEVERLKRKHKEFEQSLKSKVGTDYWKSFSKGAKHYQEQLEKLQVQEMRAVEEVQRAKNKKKKNEAKEDYNETREQIAEIKDEYREFAKTLMDEFIGTDLSSFADNLADVIFEGFDDGLTDSKEIFDNTIDDMVKGILKAGMARKLEDIFAPVFKKMEEFTADGELSQNELDQLVAMLDGMYGDAESLINGYKTLYDKYGLNSEDFKQQTESSPFQAMSQDTGDELNGRFTAIQVTTSSIDEKFTDIILFNKAVIEHVKKNVEQTVLNVQVTMDVLESVRSINQTTSNYLPQLSSIDRNIRELLEKL